MAGLEKITKTIIDTADDNAAAVIKTAEDNAQQIINAANAQAKVMADEVIAVAEKKAQGIKSSGESFCQLDAKNKILKAKMELINEVFDKSIKKLRALGSDEYFNVIKKLVVAYAVTGEGELLLSSKDKENMPSGFEGYINSALPSGKSIVIASDCDDSINGGCVLRYNDIEINCSFEALVNSEKERLTDAVNGVLFR